MEGAPREAEIRDEDPIQKEDSLETAHEASAEKGGTGKNLTRLARAAALAGALMGGETLASNELAAQSPHTIEMSAHPQETEKGKWARTFLSDRVIPYMGSMTDSKVGDYIQFTVPRFYGHYEELTQSDTSAMKEALRKYSPTDLIEISSTLSALTSAFERWHMTRQISEGVYKENKDMLDFMRARIQWAQQYLIVMGNHD